MKRAAIYARVSTRGQEDGTSLETQVEKCQRYADEHGLQVIEVCSEQESGTRRSREGLDRVLELVRGGRVDIVLFWETVRLARDIRPFLDMVDACEEADVVVFNVQRGREVAGEEELWGQLESIFGGWWVEKLKEASKRGRIKAYEQGRVLVSANNAPYGYDSVGEKGNWRLQVNEEQAKVVRLIFDLYAGGKSYRDVADELNRRGIRSARGKDWHPSSVRGVLSRERYATGKYQPGQKKYDYENDTVVPREGPSPYPVVEVPKIIDMDVWRKVQLKKKRNLKMKRKPKSTAKYLLSGMLECACGLGASGIPSYTRKDGHTNKYYRCNSYNRMVSRKKCEYATSYLGRRLEGMVVRTVLANLTDPESVREWAEWELNRQSKQEKFTQGRLDDLEKEILRQEQALDRLADDFIYGMLDQDQIAEKRRDVLRKLNELKSARDEYLLKKPQWDIEDVMAGREHILEVLSAYMSPDVDVKELGVLMASLGPDSEEREVDGETVTVTYPTPWERLRDLMKEIHLRVVLWGRDEDGTNVAEIRYDIAPGIQRKHTVNIPVGRV